MSLDLRFERLLAAPPERVFDAFTDPEGQREFYGTDAAGWVVDSRCDLRVGGVWSISFGPAPERLYHHRHVFEAIDRPHRILLASTETRLDGSSFETTLEFTFEPRDGGTLMTMVQGGFPSEELRDEHTRGLPNAFNRLERTLRERRTMTNSQRQLILHMSVSLDGFIARSDGVIDWLTPRGAVDHGNYRHRANLEMLGQIGLIVIGRGAYEDMAEAWSSSDSPMAVLINALPKIVYSQSLTDASWSNARISRAALADEIPALKREPGKDIVVFGGGRIGNSLIRERLVDEYRLTVHPVALGEGIPLMHGLPEPQRLQLISSTAYGDGSVSQVLRP